MFSRIIACEKRKIKISLRNDLSQAWGHKKMDSTPRALFIFFPCLLDMGTWELRSWFSPFPSLYGCMYTKTGLASSLPPPLPPLPPSLAAIIHRKEEEKSFQKIFLFFHGRLKSCSFGMPRSWYNTCCIVKCSKQQLNFEKKSFQKGSL